MNDVLASSSFFFVNFYKGFHDVCATLLALTGSRQKAAIQGLILARRLLSHYMHPDDDRIDESSEGSVTSRRHGMDPGLPLMLEAIKYILDKEKISFSGDLVFTVSWLVTLFTHDIPGLETKEQILLYILRKHPVRLVSAYLSAALIKRHALFNAVVIDAEESFQELKSLPLQEQDLVGWFAASDTLIQKYPPHSLMHSVKLKNSCCLSLILENDQDAPTPTITFGYGHFVLVLSILVVLVGVGVAWYMAGRGSGRE